MCDICLIEGQPTFDFSTVKGFKKSYSPTLKRDVMEAIQSPVVRLCLPCFRIALKAYKAATVVFCATLPPESMTDALRTVKGQLCNNNQSSLSTIN